MFGINRLRAINRIIEFANQIPDCAATRLRIIPSAEPDVLVVIRGRAIFFRYVPQGKQIPNEAIDAAAPYTEAGARIVFVRDNPARVLDIIAQVAQEQDRIYAYDPKKDWR